MPELAAAYRGNHRDFGPLRHMTLIADVLGVHCQPHVAQKSAERRILLGKARPKVLDLAASRDGQLNGV